MFNNVSIFLKSEYITIRIRDEAKMPNIIKELNEKLPELKKFYKEEKTPILVTGKMLKMKEMDEIKDLIEKNIKVKVDFESPNGIGLHAIKKNFKKEIESSETKFYNGSLRSGQKIEFEGSVVIIGDVNSGAEVIAEDNIVVLGNLRGMAHAGAKGNENAIIAARIIDSLQIRIASKIKERSREDAEIQAFSIAYINSEDEIQME